MIFASSPSRHRPLAAHSRTLLGAALLAPALLAALAPAKAMADGTGLPPASTSATRANTAAAPTTPIPAAPTPAAPAVDNSARFYTKQSETGATVLGNGAAEDGATVLTVRAPAVVGGAAPATLTEARGAIRPGAAAVAAAVNGTAPVVNYSSNAVRDDLKSRDEKLATRVSQMIHRRNGLAGNAAAPAAASPDGN